MESSLSKNVSVVVHVSELYSSTVSTMDLNSIDRKESDNVEEFQIVLKRLKALHASARDVAERRPFRLESSRGDT